MIVRIAVAVAIGLAILLQAGGVLAQALKVGGFSGVWSVDGVECVLDANLRRFHFVADDEISHSVVLEQQVSSVYAASNSLNCVTVDGDILTIYTDGSQESWRPKTTTAFACTSNRAFFASGNVLFCEDKDGREMWRCVVSMSGNSRILQHSFFGGLIGVVVCSGENAPESAILVDTVTGEKKAFVDLKGVPARDKLREDLASIRFSQSRSFVVLPYAGSVLLFSAQSGELISRETVSGALSRSLSLDGASLLIRLVSQIGDGSRNGGAVVYHLPDWEEKWRVQGLRYENCILIGEQIIDGPDIVRLSDGQRIRSALYAEDGLNLSCVTYSVFHRRDGSTSLGFTGFSQVRDTDYVGIFQASNTVSVLLRNDRAGSGPAPENGVYSSEDTNKHPD